MRAVHAAAFRLSVDADVAKDLTQEAYLRAYRTFDNFEQGTNCRAWLLKIVYTVFVNRYHKNRRELNKCPWTSAFIMQWRVEPGPSTSSWRARGLGL